MKMRTMVMAIAAVFGGITGVLVNGGDPPAAAAGQQFTWFDQTMTHGPTREYAQANATAPDDWTTPVDYANGRVYARLEILTKPSTLPTAAQICIWRSNFTEESCSPSRTFSSPGVYWIDFGRPTSWWKLGGSFSWTTPFSPTRIMIKDAATGKLLLSERCGTSCYTGTDLANHVPITMSAEAIVVAAGSTLAPPADWTGCPTAWSAGCSTTGGTTPPPTTAPPPTTTPPTTVPPAPGGDVITVPGAGPDQPTLRIETTGTAITTSWDPVNRATRYQFRHRIVGQTLKWKSPGTYTSATITPIVANRTYVVEARALISGTWRPWTTGTVTTNTTPPPPTTVPPPTTEPPVTTSPPPPGGAPWADTQRSYRLPVALGSAPVARAATFADVPIDLAAALSTAGGIGTPAPATIRVVEVDTQGAVIDTSVDTQFDQRSGSPVGVGTLVVATETPTPAATTRRYHVYFDVTGSAVTPVAATAPRISVTSGPDAGQDSFLVDTPAGDWAYHKAGGGFSSLVDADGNDWLNYSTTPGSAGTFRGMPNMVHPDGHFHPGATSSTTTVESSGPLKVTLRSTAPGGWATRWEIYPDRARMQVLAASAAYWFLYEGTPGGQIDSGDVVIRSGSVTPLTQAWTGDLASPEYVGFADTTRDRSLVAIHHQNDAGIDSYRLMQSNMTVFGFGRDQLDKSLTGTNHSFTVALVETDVTTQVRNAAAGLHAEFVATTATPERR